MAGSNIYIVGGKRTPFGKFGGSLVKHTPVDLAVSASKSALNEANIKPEQIDHVVLGNVVPSSTDTMYGGRHLALKLGCPEKTPGYVLNRLCGSGIQAIWDAFNLVSLGRANCVLASGTENMSMIPHLVYGSRFGTKYGPLKTVDMLLDALTDKYAGTPMGITAENLAVKFKIDRQACDEYSLNSHLKAAKAYENNLLQGEIAGIETKRGLVDKDEHVRADATIEQMTKLSPSFQENGTVTPATASGIVDGASSLVVAGEEFVKSNNLRPLARICDFEVIGVDPTHMGIGPSPAIKSLLSRNSKKIQDIDLFEINEAFAAQILACVKDLDLDQEKLNIWGGAIAIGHPLAATGTRITYTLTRQLIEQKKKFGIASACIGGGQGIAVLVENLNV